MARVLTSLLILLFASCDRSQVQTKRFFSFGTIVEFSMLTSQPSLAQQANTLVQTELVRMHHDWHAWEPGKLTQTNEMLQQQQFFSADPEIMELIERAQRLQQRSDGLFDPAIGSLVEHWGFYNDQPAAPSPKTKLNRSNAGPSENFIKSWLATRPSVLDIEVTNKKLRGMHPDLKLDFGGLAKGFALDKIAKQLVALGLTDFILNAGGDLVVRGQNLDRHWRVGIRNPEGEKVTASITVFDGEGVFSSGDYERYYLQNNQRIHHIIDPRDGRPASAARAVTVIHTDATLADAAATALLIAGRDDWQKIAKQMQVKLVMLHDADGEIHLSEAMRQRLDFSESFNIGPNN